MATLHARFVHDSWDDVGQIYGLMLTAWSFGGVLGPLLISRVIDVTGSYTLAFYIIAAIMVGSAVVAFIVRPPTRRSESQTPQAEGARARIPFDRSV
jgi:MFS transporter, OFA family, oxalate/formate antiporter